MNAPPLADRRILLTRRGAQAARLAAELRALGATVLEAPLIDVQPPDSSAAIDTALKNLATYDWVILTSANAVEALGARGEHVGLESWPSAVRVACVGPASSAAFERRFRHPVYLQPQSDYRAEGLLETFSTIDLSGRRLLLPLSDRARATLAEGLRARGARVDALVAYRVALPEDAVPRLQASLEQTDLVVFASPSAVENFIAVTGADAPRKPAIVIGPVTAQAARSAGIVVLREASPATTDGLLAAILSWARAVQA